MQYKVVPFSASIGLNQGSAHLATHIEQLIAKYVSDGWEYVAVEQLQTFQAGSNGCFGLGATPATTVNVEFVVFRK